MKNVYNFSKTFFVWPTAHHGVVLIAQYSATMLFRSGLVRGSTRLVSQARRARGVATTTTPTRSAATTTSVARQSLPRLLPSSWAPAARAALRRPSLVNSSSIRIFSSATEPPNPFSPPPPAGGGGGGVGDGGGGGVAGAGAPPSPEGAQLPFVVDVDGANFEQVMVQSFGVPTIIDCHADWCGPCKQLAPILEDVVRRAGGRLRLAKLDIDANKELAAQLRVQSVPTVYGVAGGKIVDQFVGLPAQEQFQGFIDKLMQAAAATANATPPPSAESPATPEEMMDAGMQALRHGDFDGAGRFLETVIALEESEEEGLKAKAEREGGPGRGRAQQKTEEQVKLEELAAVAHASKAQLLLVSGKPDDALQ